MPPAEPFTRSYTLEYRQGEADGATVADLLQAAAEKLRRAGRLTVHHLSFEVSDSSVRPSVQMTVYYDLQLSPAEYGSVDVGRYRTR